MKKNPEIKQLADRILAELGKDWDITKCSFCGKEIVVHDAQMDLPACNNLECTARLLNIQSDYFKDSQG